MGRSRKRFQRGNVTEVGRIEQASPQGEAGLLGLAVSPSYDEDGLVYAYVRANYVRQKTIMLWMLGNGQAVSDPPNP